MLTVVDGVTVCGGTLADRPATVDDLANLSIEQLGNVTITSVSKSDGR